MNTRGTLWETLMLLVVLLVLLRPRLEFCCPKLVAEFEFPCPQLVAELVVDVAVAERLACQVCFAD